MSDEWTPKDMPDTPVHEKMATDISETIETLFRFSGRPVGEDQANGIRLVSGLLTTHIENTLIDYAYKSSRINAENALRQLFDRKQTFTE